MPNKEPNLLAKATGRYSRDQFRNEAAHDLGVKREDVDDKLVDALVATTNRTMMMALGFGLLFLFLCSMVLGVPLAFGGYGFSLTSQGAESVVPE